jgi:hypothetical protein
MPLEEVLYLETYQESDDSVSSLCDKLHQIIRTRLGVEESAPQVVSTVESTLFDEIGDPLYSCTE